MDNLSSEPTVMSLDLLREITNGFSEERKIGSGTFGKVYLGVHQDREIAVKKLYDMPGLDEEHFQNEFKNLTMLCHENIVRLVGYCHDVQEVQVKHEGKLVLAQRIHRALCLEYMSNGSLNEYLSDECDRYDWYTGYRIIKGICEGLKYLHKELYPPIYHLDLKPGNVLLDKNMRPRIADFGMSKLFGDEKTRATKSSLGTLGYLPPEYIRSNLVSNKFDIFSLGVVIIKIMAGRTGYFNSADMSSQEFISLVHQKWRNRLHETLSLTEAYSEQIKVCIEIGLSCVQEDRHKRPTIQDIVDTLNKTDTETYLSRNGPPLMYQEASRNAFVQYDQHPNDPHAKQIYHEHAGATSKYSWIETLRVASWEQTPDDGFSWSKYGEKRIIGAKFPRGYYRCTYRKSHCCAATKQMQRSDNDPSEFLVTYMRTHRCHQKQRPANAALPSPRAAGARDGGHHSPLQYQDFQLMASASLYNGLHVETEGLPASASFHGHGVSTAAFFPNTAATSFSPVDCAGHEQLLAAVPNLPAAGMRGLGSSELVEVVSEATSSAAAAAPSDSAWLTL